MHSLQPCGALVACGRRLFLQAISPPFLVVSSSTKKHDGKRRVFLMCAKFFAHICTISSKLCVEPVGCARCLFLQAIPHLRLPSKLSRQTSRRYGVPFLCASRTPLQKLCRRVRRRRSRLPLASNFSLFSCRQQLYGLFCHRRLSAAVLFVWFFNFIISWIIF